MAIPVKKQPSNSKRFINDLFRIKHLPKGKLFGLTVVLMYSSYSFYYLFSDYRKYIKSNIIIREVEGIRSSLPVTENTPLHARKPFPPYGLDFIKTSPEEKAKD